MLPMRCGRSWKAVDPNSSPTTGAPGLVFARPRHHYVSVPRGRPGFDGGREVAWSMPRASSSSIIRWQKPRRERRRLRSGRLRPSPEPTCACARGCRVIITGSLEAGAFRQEPKPKRLVLRCASHTVLPRDEIKRWAKHVAPGAERLRTRVQFPPPPPTHKKGHPCGGLFCGSAETAGLRSPACAKRAGFTAEAGCRSGQRQRRWPSRTARG